MMTTKSMRHDWTLTELAHLDSNQLVDIMAETATDGDTPTEGDENLRWMIARVMVSRYEFAPPRAPRVNSQNHHPNGHRPDNRHVNP